MKALYRAVLLTILLTSSAAAQIDTQADGVGIYADAEGMVAGVHQEAGVPLEVYLLLTNPSSELLYGGFECGIEVPDNALVWGFNFPQPGTIAVINDTDFMAAWGSWLPLQTVNVLMTFIITPLDDRCAFFNVTANTGNGQPGEPVYLVEGDDLIPMRPYSSAGGATFALNADQQLPTVDATLDQVKALYR